MIVSIHQPDYIPYLGYFYKIEKSDLFIFLDDVQFSNNNMHHWNKIKTPQGECRLKIPVKYDFGDHINEVSTKDQLNWKQKHLKTIEMNYSRCRYFNEIFKEFKMILLENYTNLSYMNIAINMHICKKFEFKTNYQLASNFAIKTKKENRVIDICKAAGANTYISGNGARVYQSSEHFKDNGINLVYTNYSSFEYDQQWKGFLPNLSVLDYIFNCGYDWERVVRCLDLN